MPASSRAEAAKANGAALSNQTKLLNALTAFRKGDFSVRLPIDWTGIDGKIADAFNEVIELNQRDGARAAAHQPRRRQGRQDLAARVDRRRARRVGHRRSSPSTR